MEPLSATSQFGHTFGDDLCGFHRGLTQLRILDDLTLDPQTLLLQMIAQGVEFVNQSIDLPEARARNLSKERIGAVRSDLAATFRLLLGTRMPRRCGSFRGCTLWTPRKPRVWIGPWTCWIR